MSLRLLLVWILTLALGLMAPAAAQPPTVLRVNASPNATNLALDMGIW